MNTLLFLGSQSPVGVIVGMIIILSFARFFMQRNVSSMVLKKFSLNQNPDDGNFVSIIGRKSGLLSWLLTLIGLDPQVEFIVATKDLRFYNKSLFGEKNIVMTLKNVSHINCEYSRPFWYLVFAILSLIMFLIGDSGIALGFLVIAIILLLVFYFNKSITIMVETFGGAIYKVKFKPSLIENVNVNLDKARKVVELINSQIIKEQERLYR
jgi:hypothetical protein